MPLRPGDKLGPCEILAPIGKLEWVRCARHMIPGNAPKPGFYARFTRSVFDCVKLDRQAR
jgi:hypothetical protein